MGPITKELVSVLKELIAVLDSDCDTHWSALIRRSKSQIESSDYSGIELLLSVYGGMGSFNDLALGQTLENGVVSWKTGHIELNEKLSLLRSKAWRLANKIKHAQ